MKKILLSLLIILASITLDAQSISYRGDVGIQMGTSLCYWKMYSSRYVQAVFPGAYINTTHGIEWNETITAGAGVGIGPFYAIDPHSDPIQADPFGFLTLYAHFDYAFQRGNPKRPFIGTRVGYNFTFTKQEVAGFPEVGAGIGFRLNDRWDIGAWYMLGFVLDDRSQVNAFMHMPLISVSWRFP